MQIYVDPKHPTHALDSVRWQLKMLICLLSQDCKGSMFLDDEALVGMCELLHTLANTVTEVGELAAPANRRAA
jgi:hypothetical protein